MSLSGAAAAEYQSAGIFSCRHQGRHRRGREEPEPDNDEAGRSTREEPEPDDDEASELRELAGTADLTLRESWPRQAFWGWTRWPRRPSGGRQRRPPGLPCLSGPRGRH